MPDSFTQPDGNAMNSDIYYKNLAVIKKKFPYIVEELEKAELGGEEYLFGENEGGDYLLYQRENGALIQNTSMVNVDEECEVYMENLDFTFNRTAIILTAIRVGKMAEKILDKLNEKSVLFCVERDTRVLKEVLHRRDFSEYLEDEKLILITTGDESMEEYIPMKQQIRSLVRTLFPNVIAKTQPVIFPIYDKGYISFSKEVLRHFQEEKNYVQFAIGNNVDDTLVGVDNYILNNDQMVKHVGVNQFKEVCKDTYKGKPAIVVASGPSLNNNVHLLKGIEDKALILSCDGSLRMLKKLGIKTDAIGSVERTRETYECFYEKDTFPEETVLVCPTVVDPNIPPLFDKSIMFPKAGLGDAHWVDTFSFGEKGCMACGPSVSHMLFHFAHEMGCEPIILIGQDLAYSKDGLSHNSEAKVVMETFDEERVAVEAQTQKEYEYYVDDINGDKVPTNYIWKKFLKAYEDILADLDVKAIDASEGGARIKGTDVMTLQEVIDTYIKDSEPIPMLEEMYAKVKQDADFYKRSKLNGYDLVNKKIKQFEKFRKRVVDAVDMIDESKEIVEDKINTQKQLDFLYDTIEFAGEDLITEVKNDFFYNILFNYYIKVALYRLNYVEGDSFTEENIKFNILILEKLYEMMELYTTKTERLLIEHSERMAREIAEEFPHEEIQAFDYSELMEKFSDEKYDIPDPVRLGYVPDAPRKVNLDAR